MVPLQNSRAFSPRIRLCGLWRNVWKTGYVALGALMGIAGAGVGRSVVGAADIQLAKIPAALGRTVDYASEVRPLLETKCYACHGPKRSENGLRLDDRNSALRGGDFGPAIVPGKSAESVMIHAVSHARSDLGAMPKKGDRLSEAEIALLRAWIDQGAAWKTNETDGKSSLKHWAFVAPSRPEIPKISGDLGRVQNPIDAFIGARLEKEGLAFSPEADRTTLMRRLHLDLVGLPPSIAEVDAFLANHASSAYGELVERLLASKHYGERWGRHWLDAARYADSDGFEKDKSRQVWFYRDWVIQALNRDLPYDQFIIEQIAGDLLPGATQDQIVATGFLRNSMLNEEGGVDPEQFRMDAMFDRMDCVGKSILGLTIQCAQCHSHKYDPISQDEYYRLFAYLNNDHEFTRVVYTPAEQKRVADLSREMRKIEEELQHRTTDWQQRMLKWERETSASARVWTAVTVTNAGDHGQRYIQQGDHSVLAQGYAPTKFTTMMRVTQPVKGSIGSVRLELLNHADLPCNGPGRSVWGTCALTEFNVEAVDAANPTNKVELKWVRVTADYANPIRDLESIFDDRSGKKRVTGPVEYAIDGKDETAWGMDAGPGRRNVPREAVFVPEKPVQFEAGTILTFKLRQSHGGWNSDDNQNNNLGRFRLSVSSDTNAVADRVPARVREILAIDAGRRSAAQKAAVFAYWRTLTPEFKDANERIESLWRQWPEGGTALTFEPRSAARDTRILKRGDWLKPGKEVSVGTPAFLHPAPVSADASRLTLARWLADRRSPTTARVFVNRVWQSYFGVGIVETPEDFGVQSPAPSHPELLDWLACEFMEPKVSTGPGDALTPWSIKHLHRLIVSSKTYRQSSRLSSELAARDPYNRLLARAPRLRVEGEVVRDIALAASGLLNPQVGGPSIFSPAPPSLFLPPNSYGPFDWKEATGADRYRRAVYTFRRRSTPYPMLANFDAPTGDFSCVRRSRSNTPLQALTAMNEPVFMECARALARTVLKEGGPTDADRVTYAFRRVLGRSPAPEERDVLLRLLDRCRQRVADGWVSAHELSTGSSERPNDLPTGTHPTLLAAYTAVSRALLNLDETITKE